MEKISNLAAKLQYFFENYLLYMILFWMYEKNVVILHCNFTA